MTQNDLVPVKEKSVALVDPAAVAAAETAKARIQAAYLMALQKPRNREDARVNILEGVKRPIMAERCEYRKPVGGTTIKGPSIRLAEHCLREWGNILTEVQVLHEDDDIRRVRVAVIDLETNASFGRDIQIKKTVERKNPPKDREILEARTNTRGQKVYIVRATDDELVNKEAAQVSKILRNEGLRLIPSDIIDEAMEAARQTMADQDAKDPAAGRKKLIDSFATLGVKPKDLESYLGHDLDQTNPHELVDLRAIYQAIKDGETTWKDIVTVEAEADPDKKLKSKADKVKDKLKEKKPD
jgi:hypothetical protein